MNRSTRRLRGRKPKNKDNCPQTQAPAKSHLKLVEDLKAEAAPVANILGGGPAPGPDPFDLAAAVVDQNYLNAAATEQVARPVKIRKPGKELFRAFPHYQYFNLYADIVEGKIDKDFYFVMPQMAAAMEGETFKAALVLCVNMHQIPFFWPVRALDEDRANAWTDSAHTAIKTAVEKWVKIRANQKPGAGYYDVSTAKGELGEPEFPAKDAASYMTLLSAATPPERKIGTPDHPIFFHKVEGRR
jgi:hypothetical protein